MLLIQNTLLKIIAFTLCLGITVAVAQSNEPAQNSTQLESHFFTGKMLGIGIKTDIPLLPFNIMANIGVSKNKLNSVGAEFISPLGLGFAGSIIFGSSSRKLLTHNDIKIKESFFGFLADGLYSIYLGILRPYIGLTLGSANHDIVNKTPPYSTVSYRTFVKGARAGICIPLTTSSKVDISYRLLDLGLKNIILDNVKFRKGSLTHYLSITAAISF